MFRWLILVLLALAPLVPASLAQMRGGGRAPLPHVTPGFAQSIRFPGHPRGRGFARGRYYLGDPFFYSDYDSGSLAYDVPPPPLIIMQSASAESAPETKSEPLLIEWHSDRYVRFDGGHESATGVQNTAPDYAEAVATRSFPLTRTGAGSVNPGQSEAADLMPVVLVYRDGRQEEVSNYAIVSGVLYARGNYWQDGYWRKNIQLAALNIPATMKANQDSGVKFVLPSGPNDVVTRP